MSSQQWAAEVSEGTLDGPQCTLFVVMVKKRYNMSDLIVSSYHIGFK